MHYDVIIVGGGPAGLSAAIYTSRAGWNTLLLEKSIPGGLVNTTYSVENYPGFPEGTSGMELMEKFKKQAEKFGTRIKTAEVNRIIPAGKQINIEITKEKLNTSALIIATGTIPRKLGVPGEEELLGKGISYCATCDGALYRGKDVIVAGCGNSGVEEGTFLLKFASSVTFIATSPYIRADKILQDRAKADPKTRFMTNKQILSINGKNKMESVTFKDRTSGKEETVKAEGIFIYKGGVPSTKFLQEIIKLDKQGYIITNQRMETNIAGIFAAGDVCAKPVRQIATACGEGVTAALAAESYLAHQVKS